MTFGGRLRLSLALLLPGLAGCTPSAPTPAPLSTLDINWQWLRYWDDQHRLLESRGSDTTTFGMPAAQVGDSLAAARDGVRPLLLAALAASPPAEARPELEAMRSAWHGGLSGDSSSGAGSAGGTLARLTDSVLDAYGHAANIIMVDGDTLNRLAILGLLSHTDDPARRARLWRALEPVWRSVNAGDEPDSPYRRLLRLRRAAWGDSTSPIDRKGPAFGLSTAELEHWLVAALGQWRSATPDSLLEPWDWYYSTDALSRRLGQRVSTIADILRVSNAYYRQIGADPVTLGVHYDLEPRPGKYPVAFTDFGVRPRWTQAGLVPGEPWVFTSYLSGSLGNLAELLHESGHAIHIAAIRTRPAFIDWPDNDTFTEALADLPAMELYEPGWQLHFLGDSAPIVASITAKYSGIVFDMAWALFEIRIHRDPSADPNIVWTDITRDYLHIRPHPEWSWWAMRGQLIDGPGYLINYALGAFLVADMRAAIRGQRGAAAWSDPQMYAWLSTHIYRFGLERPSRKVLEDLLWRSLRPEALLDDLGRIVQR